MSGFYILKGRFKHCNKAKEVNTRQIAKCCLLLLLIVTMQKVKDDPGSIQNMDPSVHNSENNRNKANLTRLGSCTKSHQPVFEIWKYDSYKHYLQLSYLGTIVGGRFFMLRGYNILCDTASMHYPDSKDAVFTVSAGLSYY